MDWKWLNDYGGLASWLQVALIVFTLAVPVLLSLFKKIYQIGHDRFSKKGIAQAWEAGQFKNILSRISEGKPVLRKSVNVARLLTFKKALTA